MNKQKPIKKDCLWGVNVIMPSMDKVLAIDINTRQAKIYAERKKALEEAKELNKEHSLLRFSVSKYIVSPYKI